MSTETGVWGMKLQEGKKIQVSRPMRIVGKVCNVGNIVTVSEEDAFCMIASGRATAYPPPPEEKVSPAELANRRKAALNCGPYKVEITKRCFVKGYICEPGEIVSLDKDDASNFFHSSYGKVIAVPSEEETVEDKVSRMIEEKLREVPGKR